MTSPIDCGFGNFYDPESRVFSCGWNAGLFSVLSTLLAGVLKLRHASHWPARIDMSRGLQHFKDEPSVDAYPALFDRGPPPSEPCRTISFDATGDHHLRYRDLPLEALSSHVFHWFGLNAQLLALQDLMLRQAGVDPALTVAVIYRGTDKGSEVTLAEPKRFLRAAQRVMRRLGLRTVLIQTDQRQVRDLFADAFGPQAVWFNGMPVTGGTRVLHQLPTSDLGVTRQSFASHLIAATHAASRCAAVITYSGNMGFWACLYRGHAQGVWQFDAHGVLVAPPDNDGYADRCSRAVHSLALGLGSLPGRLGRRLRRVFGN